MKKKVLVTGGSGAIGKKTIEFLVNQSDNYKVTCLIHNKARAEKRIGRLKKTIEFVEGDLTKVDTLKPHTSNLDFVIHLAAVIPPLADEKPELARKVNFEGSKNLIQLIEENSPNAFFLYASSIAVYGDRLHTPEIRVSDKLIHSRGDAYAKTKIDTEKIIRDSKIKWTIFRLTGIMDAELNKPNALMFHMPLDTSFEMCTTEDCGRAFVNALEHENKLVGNIYNLAGGESCRAKFKEFLESAFKVSGLGKVDFPEGAFGTANFHCGYYMDGDDLENIIQFRNNSKEDYFKAMGKAIPEWQKLSAKLFAPIIKWGMLQTSEPWKAKKKNNKEGMKQFFNIDV